MIGFRTSLWLAAASVLLTAVARVLVGDQEWMIRRRRTGEEDLLLIRGLIGAEGHLGRSHISNRLCEIWDWRQANDRFRQIAQAASVSWISRCVVI